MQKVQTEDLRLYLQALQDAGSWYTKYQELSLRHTRAREAFTRARSLVAQADRSPQRFQKYHEVKEVHELLSEVYELLFEEKE